VGGIARNAFETAPVVATSHGQVRGVVDGGVVVFKGIPFAGRIDGPGRFERPRPPIPWPEVLDARTWAPPVPQAADAFAAAHTDYFSERFGNSDPAPQTESGLYLNVWTADTRPDVNRPVMVWLHGGGFATGAPSRPREDGTFLARDADVVVVAPSHRLGALGYLYLDEITNGRVRSANVGLLDIIAALEWVRDNIHAFGGDPRNVTVFGESGGSAKVHALLAIESARGLFHRAVLQAGAFAHGSLITALTTDEATSLTGSFLASVGIDPLDLRALRAVPMERLIQAQAREPGGLLTWRPVVDGEVLRDAPERAVAHGSARDIPLLIGCSAHEADMFFSFPDGGFGTLDDLVPVLGRRADTLVERYATRRGGDRHEAARAVMTDWMFRLPSIRLAEAQSDAGGTAFMYLFDWTDPERPDIRSSHGTEAPFVFGTIDATPFTTGVAGARELSAVVQRAWSLFARRGDPNDPGLPEWPRYSRRRRATMVLNDPSRVVIDPLAEDRLVWLETDEDATAPVS
jgi:para-nitrobenzyl esterase